MAKIYGGAAAFLAVVAAIFALRRDAVKDERKDAHIEDLENAEDIRTRSSRVDDSLRKYDDAGWRD
tara:strand:+ start:3916 stop:4113 length:198 start_codon:yes stop_codon:yes gene_type:complete